VEGSERSDTFLAQSIAALNPVLHGKPEIQREFRSLVTAPQLAIATEICLVPGAGIELAI
jgi:hypothetical protein